MTSLAVAALTSLPAGALTAVALSEHSSAHARAIAAAHISKVRGHVSRATATETATATSSPSPSLSATASASPTASATTELPSPTATPSITASATTTALPTSDSSPAGLTEAQLVDGIGVNIHPGWLDTTYVQNGTANATLDSLERLGVKRVRFVLDKKPQSYIPSFLDGLRTDGIKALAVVGTPTGRWGTYASGESAQLRDALTTGVYKDRLSELEMPNEWDHNGGTDWSGELAAFDNEYVPALSTTSVGMPILGPSMAHTSGYAGYHTSRAGEIRNIHPYGGRLLPEASGVLPSWLEASSASSPSNHVAATELGWPNATGAFDGISESQSAGYLLRSLIWNRTHGVDQSYIYELFDEKPEPAQQNREEHFGLVSVSGDPSARSTWTQKEKPAYTQLRHLLAHLGGSGTGTAATVPYTVTDAPSDIYSTRLLRSDGSMDIAIWRKIPLTTDTYTGRSTATVQFSSPVAASAYDSVTGSTTELTASGTSVQVPVSGAVTIVRVSGAR